MRITVWDLPLRLFHWLLVLAVAGALITINLGVSWIEWHGRFGLAVVGLISFRLAWGVLGSTHSRFCSFFPTPGKIGRYLRGQWHQPGHNPLGALSVYALLVLFGFQAVSGLFTTDEIAFSGPLTRAVSSDMINTLSRLHRQTELWLYLLLGLHVLAIAVYRLCGKNLVGPMLHGQLEVDASADKPRGGGLLAFIIAVLIAAAAVWLANGSWIPVPPPAPAPSW
ncbi:MAG: cytochrome b/b6 domain-containing protein [Pseudomonas sp.]